MPGFIRTQRDENIWSRAKKKVKKSKGMSDSEYWGTVTKIYKNMCGTTGRKMKKSLIIRRTNMNKIFLNLNDGSMFIKAKAESTPSLKPPKEWWNEMYSKIKNENPRLKDINIRKIVGSIWFNQMKTKTKKVKRATEGKKYGKAKK